MHDEDHKPRSFGGKLLVCFITVTSFVFTAMYTANLTTVLVTKQQELVFTASSVETLSPDDSLCMLGALTNMMSWRFPHLTNVPKATEDDMYNGTEAGTGLSDDCDALAVSVRANEHLEPHCSELGISNPNVLALQLGQPAAAEFARIFSYWLARMNEEDLFPGGNTTDACSAHTEEVADDGGEEKITFQQILPLIWFCGIGIVWAFVEYAIRLYGSGETMMRHEYQPMGRMMRRDAHRGAQPSPTTTTAPASTMASTNLPVQRRGSFVPVIVDHGSV